MNDQYYYSNYYLWSRTGRESDEDWGKCSVYGMRVLDNIDAFNPIRSIEWNSWGDKLASLSEDRAIRIYSMGVCEGKQLQSPMASLYVGEEIFDWIWHPYHPSLIATTCSGLPIQIWCLEDFQEGDIVNVDNGNQNGDDGDPLEDKENYSLIPKKKNFKQICSYLNDRSFGKSRQALSLCFSNDGLVLISGYCSAINIHDINRPDKVVKSFKSTKNAEKKFKGYVSNIKFHPFWKFFAASTFQGHISTFDPNTPENRDLIQLTSIFDYPTTGVAQLLFAPDGNKLFVSPRRVNHIYCWDIRRPNEYLLKLERTSKNGQRIQFDIDKTGRILASGSQELGQIKVWETENFQNKNEWVQGPELSPIFGDTIVNSFKFNRRFDMWALSTGTRVFPTFSKKSVKNKSLILIASY